MSAAFIFDVDGTLAETEELHRKSFDEAFAAERLGWHWDQYCYKELLAVSGGKERIRHYIEMQGIAPVRPVDELVPALHALKTAIYGKAVRDGALELRSGVRELLCEARDRGVTLAIATTTSPGNIDELLRAALGTSDMFGAIACGDMVPAKKPAPDIYHLALRQLGLPPEACLAFEDSRNGLRSAKAAGLRCVVTPALYTSDEDFSEADLVTDDLATSRVFFDMLGVAGAGGRREEPAAARRKNSFVVQ